MPDVYGPFTGQTWQQSAWYRDAASRELSGVFGAVFTAPDAGDLALTTSGLTVTLALGRAHVRGAGYERTGTAWSATLATNTATNPRVDRLVLRRDLAAQTVLPTVLQGTPAASPAAPAVTQVEDGVWDLPLFSVTVPGGSGTTLSGIVDERVPGDLGALRRNVLWPVNSSAALISSIDVGFTLASVYVRRVGLNLCYLDTVWNKAATTYTAPANGNLTSNVQLGILAAAYAPPLNTPMQQTTTGVQVGGFLAPAGGIVLSTMQGGAVLNVGDQIQLSTGFYPLAAVAGF
jgi:hypothetical protein